MNQEVKILLVDDDPGHRSLMRRNLERCKITNEMQEFEDGQQLIDFFAKAKERGELSQQAYIIFLDIRMPKMNGFEVLERMKTDLYLKRIPIIMVTTTDDPDEISKCHDLGCNHYVTKPVDYDQFIHAVQNLGLFLSIVKVPRLT